MPAKKPVCEDELRAWSRCLLNPEASLVDRSRALWGLRHASEPLALQLIADFICDVVHPSPVANDLLQHEAAYCLGQRGDVEAVPYLVRLVRDSRHTGIVRHEASEALAALYDRPGVNREEISVVLHEFASSDVVELAQTCQVGLGRIRWIEDQSKFDGSQSTVSDNDIAHQFFPETVDPAPSFGRESRPDSLGLYHLLMDPKESLFTRYQALFSLRDLVLEEWVKSESKEESNRCVLLLAEGVLAPGSALLRHEVAFVLGQLANQVSIPNLTACVEQTSEHPMVRHEAAEALGAVLGHSKVDECHRSPSENAELLARARDVLHSSLKDKEPIVRESCVLALDIADYTSSTDQFQYASVPS